MQTWLWPFRLIIRKVLTPGLESPIPAAVLSTYSTFSTVLMWPCCWQLSLVELAHLTDCLQLYIKREISEAAEMNIVLLLLLDWSYLIHSGDEAHEWFTKKRRKKKLEKNSRHELIKTVQETSKVLLIRRLKVWSDVSVVWWAVWERITEQFDPENEIEVDYKWRQCFCRHHYRRIKMCLSISEV